MVSQSGNFLNYKFLPGFQENDPRQNIRFVAFSGNSMVPTLREPELMEVVPYQGSPIRRGDVIYFTHQNKVTDVVHRVVAITGQGVITRGDNNPTVDNRVIPLEQIIGKVTVVWGGSKRRVIWGGWNGHMLGIMLHGLSWLNANISRRLSPIYYWLCRSRFFSRKLPRCFQPRVIHFQDDGKARLFLFWGDIMIGKYVDARRQWIIRRPYRLIINEDLLNKQPIEWKPVKTKQKYN